MAKRKRGMTSTERAENLKAMKVGEYKHFYKHNMTIKKGDPQPDPFYTDKPKTAKVLISKEFKKRFKKRKGKKHTSKVIKSDDMDR